MPFKHNNIDLYGYTEKVIAKVFIPYNFDSHKNKFDIEALINFFSNLLITILHEQFKHYLKMLIFFNSFIHEKKVGLLSNNNLSLKEKDDEIYLNIIKACVKYNNPKKKIVNLPACIDGGHKLEIIKKTKIYLILGKENQKSLKVLLFGNIINEIFISASLDIFTYSSWKLNIKDHLDRFIKLNSIKNDKIIKNLNINEYEKNKDISEFLILILKEFLKIKNIKNGIININGKYSSSRRLSLNNTSNSKVININLGYSDIFNRTRRDCRI